MKKILVLLFIITSVTLGNARPPQKGYRGFVDWDNAFGKMTYFDNTDGKLMRNTQWFIGVSTSHGYQFNPHVFLGGGLMLEGATPSGDLNFPVFADFRYDAAFGKFTPFGDVRLGYNFADGGGIYFSPTVGYRFSWNHKLGLNLGVGLTVRGCDNGDGRQNDCFFTFRLGVDF